MTSLTSVTKVYPPAAQTAELFARASWLWVKESEGTTAATPTPHTAQTPAGFPTHAPTEATAHTSATQNTAATATHPSATQAPAITQTPATQNTATDTPVAHTPTTLPANHTPTTQTAAQPHESQAAYFECAFTSDGEALTIHFSADQRCILYLDGSQIARGPDSGSPDDWFYASYRIKGLTPGTHHISAVVWWVGEGGHYSHMTVAPGFLLAAEGQAAATLTTGRGNWLAQHIDTIRFHTDRNLPGAHFIGPSISYRGRATPAATAHSAAADQCQCHAAAHAQPSAATTLSAATATLLSTAATTPPHTATAAHHPAVAADNTLAAAKSCAHLWRPCATTPLLPAVNAGGALAVPERGRLDPCRYLTPSMLPDQQEFWADAPRVRAVTAQEIDTAHRLPTESTLNLPLLRQWADGLFGKGEPLLVPAGERICVLLDFSAITAAFPYIETSLPECASGITGTEISFTDKTCTASSTPTRHSATGPGVNCHSATDTDKTLRSDACVEVLWAESLFTEAVLQDNNLLSHKGHRDEIAEKYFEGFGDTFLPDANPQGTSPACGLWWRSGRYVLLRINGGATGIRLHSLRFRQTRYPISISGSFDSDTTDTNAIADLSTTGVLACAHELYMDCPGFEQLMYAGDARIQALVHRCLDEDPRLAQKSLRLFARSRLLGGGLTLSRYPCRRSQFIPSFSFIWVLMLRDFLLWHNDAEFVRAQLPAMRSVLSNADALTGASGLLEPATGWNFIDWDKRWPGGIPQGTPNFHINAFFIMALEAAARVEQTLAPESGREKVWQRKAAQLRTRMVSIFRRADGLFADDPQHTALSHQAQALAVLADLVRPQEARELLARIDRHSPHFQHTFYFMHYWLEACGHCRYTPSANLFAPYLELIQAGVHTPIETLEPNRSDCHGWGSHPRYHAIATLLGIHPASANFASLRIEPLPAFFTKASATLPWRGQQISVQLEKTASGMVLSADIPAGLPASVRFETIEAELHAGSNRIELPCADPLAASPAAL